MKNLFKCLVILSIVIVLGISSVSAKEISQGIFVLPDEVNINTCPDGNAVAIITLSTTNTTYGPDAPLNGIVDASGVPLIGQPKCVPSLNYDDEPLFHNQMSSVCSVHFDTSTLSNGKHYSEIRMRGLGCLCNDPPPPYECSIPVTIQVTDCNEVPEFPSTFLPATMIIGFLGAVLLIQRTREH